MSALRASRPTAEAPPVICRVADRRTLEEANIHPATGLSTDYLNHFNEAVMLLEMLPAMPECRDDLAAWRPRSYREHFLGSRLQQRALTLAAYEAADPAVRGPFDALCAGMNVAIAEACASLQADPASVVAASAEAAVAWLKPRLARASAMIHGSDAATRDGASIQRSQAAIDAILDP